MFLFPEIEQETEELSEKQLYLNKTTCRDIV